MAETDKTATPASQPAVSRFHIGSPLSLAVLSVLFGLVMPPLGVLFALAAIYRAGQQSARPALWLGSLGIIVSLAAAGLYGYAYQQRVSDPNTRSYAYKDFETANLVSEEKNQSITFSRPASLAEPKGFTNNPFQYFYAHQVLVPGYHNHLPAAQITGFKSLPAGGQVTKAYTASFAKMMSADGQKSKDYATFKGSLVKHINKYLRPDFEVELSAPAAFTNDAIKSNAWHWGYDAVASNDDGTEIKLRGKVIIAIGKKYLYAFNINALLDNWNDNVHTWKTVEDSLKIDQ